MEVKGKIDITLNILLRKLHRQNRLQLKTLDQCRNEPETFEVEISRERDYDKDPNKCENPTKSWKTVGTLTI